MDKSDIKFKQQFGTINIQDDELSNSNQSLDDIFMVNENNPNFLKEKQKKVIISRSHFIMKQLSSQQYQLQQQKQEQKRLSNILTQQAKSPNTSPTFNHLQIKQQPSFQKSQNPKYQMTSIMEEQDKQQNEQFQKFNLRNIFQNVQKPPTNDEYDSKNTPFFASGPRFNEDGELIKYSIVGKPEWFIQQNSKEKKKQQPQGDQKLHRNTIELDIYEKPKNLATSQMLLLKQSSSQTLKGPDQKSLMGYKRKKEDIDPTKERVTKEQLLIQLDQLEHKMHQQSQSQQEKLANLSKKRNAVSQLVELQNEAKDDRILTKCEETDKKWFLTTNKIAQIAGRPINETLMARSGVEHRKRREESDMIDTTKTSLQMVGQNFFWETTLRQHSPAQGLPELSQKDSQMFQQSLQSQMQLQPQTNTMTLKMQIPSVRLTRTAQSTRSAANFDQMATNSYYSLSGVPGKKGHNASTFGGDDAVRMLSGSKGTIIKTVVPQEYEKIQKPKMLANIPLTRPQTTPNDQIREEFIKKVPENKKYLASYFQIQPDDLGIKGESVLKKERESLCKDGLPQFQIYIKHKNFEQIEQTKSSQHISSNQITSQDLQIQEGLLGQSSNEQIK